jgi:hypothetical protein
MLFGRARRSAATCSRRPSSEKITCNGPPRLAVSHITDASVRSHAIDGVNLLAGRDRSDLIETNSERNSKEDDMNALAKVAALAAVLIAPVAFAQDYPSSQTSPSTDKQTTSVDYTKLDTNGDGNISKSEASADPTLSAKFDKLDTDKSGSLSSTEIMAKKK